MSTYLGPGTSMPSQSETTLHSRPFSHRTHSRGRMHTAKEFLCSQSCLKFYCAPGIGRNCCLETFSQIVQCFNYAYNEPTGVRLPKSEPGWQESVWTEFSFFPLCFPAWRDTWVLLMHQPPSLPLQLTELDWQRRQAWFAMSCLRDLGRVHLW